MDHLMEFKDKLKEIDIKWETEWIESLLKKVSGYK